MSSINRARRSIERNSASGVAFTLDEPLFVSSETIEEVRYVLAQRLFAKEPSDHEVLVIVWENTRENIQLVLKKIEDYEKSDSYMHHDKKENAEFLRYSLKRNS